MLCVAGSLPVTGVDVGFVDAVAVTVEVPDVGRADIGGVVVGALDEGDVDVEAASVVFPPIVASIFSNSA